MVIGIDTSRANHFPRGGVEWYAYYLIREFYKLDHLNEYILYTPDKLNKDLQPPSSNFKEKILNWPLKRFWTLGRMSWEMIFSRPDVLFIPSHTFPLVGAKRNVITWHDVGYERYPENYTRWELASLRQGLKIALKIAETIISVSEFTKSEMVRIYDIDPKRIKVIHLGCDHDKWFPVAQQTVKGFLQRRNINLPYFVFLGRLSLKKNVAGLIRIYNRFRERLHQPHNLILVGSETPFHQEINEEIRNSPFRNEIKKLGWLPINDLPVLLSGATALIYPSIYEGFGLPPLEAMSCGCPVIASDSSSLPEIVSDAGLYAQTHDIEGFADQMIKLIENENLRDDLITKGLERSKLFNWQTCAKETLKVLKGD
ncbi:glycosyltransferase family 4 protein [Patescibacteria group bacterium]|nr:glycosyltransferase family 4 protein [Patescibacteria group bacterium]